jgi:hypothetical protein
MYLPMQAEALIAHGGFGSVYQGLWQGLEVAIKVIPQRMDHSESVREAVELAVMTTVSHPNILGVQVWGGGGGCQGFDVCDGRYSADCGAL